MAITCPEQCLPRDRGPQRPSSDRSASATAGVEPHDMHERTAAIAGHFFYFRRVALLLRHPAHQLAHDMAKLVNVLLTHDVAIGAARILNILLPVNHLPDGFRLRSRRVPHL